MKLKLNPQRMAETFWSKATVKNRHQCWNWNGSKDDQGEVTERYVVISDQVRFEPRLYRIFDKQTKARLGNRNGNCWQNKKAAEKACHKLNNPTGTKGEK